jgi:hypothetical protein
MNTFRKMLVFLGLALAANAQTVTGSIRGTVVDSGDAVLVGATVSLTNQITRQALEFLTDSN